MKTMNNDLKKKWNTKKTIINPAIGILTVLAALPHAKAEGSEGGNGGLAVVCRNAQNEITSAQVLDLVEGRDFFGFDIPQDSRTPYTQVQDVKTRLNALDPFLTRQFDKISTHLQNYTQFEKGPLPRLADVTWTPRVAIPAGCAVEQLAIFTDRTNEVRVDETIYAKLDTQNITALMAHEVIYKMHRSFSGSNRSALSREMVAYLMSKNYQPSEMSLKYADRLPTGQTLINNFLAEYNTTRDQGEILVYKPNSPLRIKLESEHAHDESRIFNVFGHVAFTVGRRKVSEIQTNASSDTAFARLEISPKIFTVGRYSEEEQVENCILVYQNGVALRTKSGKYRICSDEDHGYQTTSILLVPEGY